MLKYDKKVTIDGFSIIDGIKTAGYRAEINSSNPEEMTLTSWQINKAMCKEYRLTVRKDEAEFEDNAYAIQDEMIAEMPVEDLIEEPTEIPE